MKALLAALTLSVALPSASLAYVFDNDVPEAVKTQITTDLAFIKSFKGDGASPLHQQIFGMVDGELYDKFFTSRVTHIGMHSCGGGNAVACVIPFMGASRIWLTRNYTDFDHPQIAKMMIVFHEARHTETKNGHWSHANCPRPFLNEKGEEMKSIWTGATLAGEPACDVTPLGSYGSSTILLKNVQKFCSNCTDKVKMDAGLYADDQFGRITGAKAREQMKQDLYSGNGLL
jgi:hypothetical protein